MCGIIGAVAERNIIKILLEGLKRLEYRGYDSAGLACLIKNENLKSFEIACHRTLGKVIALENLNLNLNLNSPIGVAHTRWATHGKPSEKNAHPHVIDQRLAIVHNGIIENYQALKTQCEASGCVFESETDTEVIGQLLCLALKKLEDNKKINKQYLNFRQVIKSVVGQLKGAYGIVILDLNHPNTLYAVRSGSPLVIGLGVGENFVASDVLALLPVTSRFIYLEEGDCAEISRIGVVIWNAEGEIVQRPVVENLASIENFSKESTRGNYKHFMQKEIFEQPMVFSKLLTMDISQEIKNLWVEKKINRVKLIACGTSFHAGLMAAYWFESLARIPATAEVASEFRYKNPVIEKTCLYIFISQSGETADTLAALHQVKLQTAYTLAICNVETSALVRGTAFALFTQAGPEIGVASTKAFTSQLGCLFKVVIEACISESQKELKRKLIEAFLLIPGLMQDILALDPMIAELSAQLVAKEHCLFLGRGVNYPLAMEGALKLKEISYIHAESYPAGELKHGPLALIDKYMPVVAIAPNDELLEKLKTNLQEVAARGGSLIILTEKALMTDFALMSQVSFIKLKDAPSWIQPIIYAIPLQLLAYHVACHKGTDVDQPRNLAKSVTVE